MSNPNADNIVYNVSISNNTDTPIPFKYDEARSQYIIEKCENYYCRLFQAKVPIMSVPFFEMKPNEYFITIGNSTASLVPIQLVPGNNYVFYIEQFLECMNNAFQEAHNINFGFASPLKAPKIYYNYTINKLFIYVDSAYLNTQIFFNTKLIYKLSGFYNEFVNLGNNRDYSILYNDISRYKGAAGIAGIYSNLNYPGYLLYNQTEFYKDLLEFQSIVIATRSLKINEQLITNPPNSPNQNNSFPILAELPLTFEELNSSKYLNFAQLYPKWSDINASGHINRMDLFAYLVDDSYNLIPLVILPGQKANLRIEFIKKNLVKNY